jgi:uncharacterized protein (TIGR02266 family)
MKAGSSHQEALSDIRGEEETIQSGLEALQNKGRDLDDSGKEIDQAAAELEGQLRALAEEESRLAQRRQELKKQEREIASRRADLGKERKKLEKEQKSQQTRLDKLYARRNKIEQQMAFDEAQKSASISRDEPVDTTEQDQGEVRGQVRIAVSVEVSMHTEHNFYTGITENISEGGLFIATHDIVPMGTLVDMTISLPEKSPIEASGEVRWVRELSDLTEDMSPGVGVQFGDLKDQDKATIEEFIRSRSPLLYEVM